MQPRNFDLIVRRPLLNALPSLSAIFVVLLLMNAYQANAQFHAVESVLHSFRDGSIPNDGHYPVGAISETGTAGVPAPRTVSVMPTAPEALTVSIASQTPTQATLSAKATSGDGHPLTYTWAVSPSSTASFTAPATGSAASGATFSNTLQVSAAGTYTVTVTAVDDQNHSASAQQAVTFQQIPATVGVSPADSSISDLQDQFFFATVTDQFGTVFNPATLTWSAVLGFIDNTGFYQANSAGTDTITATATNGGVTQAGTTTLTVYPDPDAQISVTSMTPTTANLSGIAVITRYGSNGYYNLSVSPAATFTGPTSGGADGPFTSALQVSQAGTYTVTLTLGDYSPYTFTTSIDVTFNSLPTTVAVTPASVSLPEGSAQTFTAAVADQFGATFTPGSLTWSVSGGGTINAATGVFTAGTTPGTYTVTATATSSGVTQTGTATVTVTGAVHAPTITSFSPSVLQAGNLPFVLTVTGTGFAHGVTADFDGATLTPVFAASTKLIFNIPASLVATPGTFNVAVDNPGASPSNAVPFTVTPALTLTGVSPATVPAGSGPISITVTGSNFVNGCIVKWNGQPLPTFYLSPTAATATVPASYLATAGAAKITVSNPHVYSTAPLIFTVTTPSPSARQPALRGPSPIIVYAAAPAKNAAVSRSGAHYEPLLF